MSEEFHYAVDQDGVATITWDLGDKKSMNVLGLVGLDEFESHIDAAIADPAVKGLIVTSGKEDFAAGMDLNLLASVRANAQGEGDASAAAGVFAFIMRMHRVTRKMERMGADPKTGKGGKPCVVATPGTSLGIGYEIMLSGHRRIAADNPKAKIGLPEVLIGIFPGAGGTTRLLRMLGLMGAAPFILEGKLSDPRKAQSAGLIDDVVPASALLSHSKAWILNAKQDDYIKPWDKKGFKIPGGTPYHPAGFMNWVGGVAMTHGASQGAYPAIKAMLSAAYEGAMVDIDNALKIEARWFTKVLLDPRSGSMIRTLFVSKQAIEKGARRPSNIPDMKVKKVGVLGAGMMGAGIAHAAASAGIETVLVDRDQDSADRGKASIADLVAQGVKRKKITQEKADAILARVTATPDYQALAGADLIVEAVFEDPALKAMVTQKAEAVIGDDAIFATNTSTIPINDLAKASERLHNFIGIHFFSPVHKMLLVEIIRGENTGDAAVAKALDFAGQLKKTPIVVNDARFFYANRCIIPYVNEGVRMLAEGVNPALIENAARQAGIPVGPLQLSDEVSLELGLKIAAATKAAMGDAYPESAVDDVLNTMVTQKGRLGRKSKAGFFDYDEKGKRLQLWPGLLELYPPTAPQPSFEIVQNRILAIQVLEAIRALEEGVLVDIREGDVAGILGWGFAPWSGGPLSYVDILGAAAFKAQVDELARRFGPRFAAPKLLDEMAANGETFYGRFSAAA
jgi:3-hydroxyacyl-CoA dehydrogenase/enoyl-CoA hydratase/3-hydroxybutyryl-CoA epimerase